MTPTAAPPSIKLRYLLVLHIPVYRAADGTRWTDGLWYKDLQEHVVYIDDFTYACPCMEMPADRSSLVQITDPRIKFVDLPGRRKLTLGLPATVARLWRAVGRADVVHTGLGGWLPVSLGNMTAFMATLRRRFLFILVESSTWRLVPTERHSLAARIKAGLAEWMNRSCLGRVNLAVFTQAQYKQSLMARHPERGHIIHASWIDSAVIASAQTAEASWGDKSRQPRVRLLFAGRVNAAKGVQVLLEALQRLDAAGTALDLHVIGQGDLLDACREASQRLQHVCLEVKDPLPYGEAFFNFLRGYHAVVVPSISEEQPRIVYDAYSQAVPVIASSTAGLRDCIDETTGWLCPPNDVDALARLLSRAAQEPGALRAMSAACLARAREMTHQHMHERRLVLLNRYLQAWRAAPAR